MEHTLERSTRSVLHAPVFQGVPMFLEHRKTEKKNSKSVPRHSVFLCSSVQFYLCSKVFWCSGFTACTCHHEPTTNRESAASMNIQREWFLTSRWLALKCNFNYVIVLLLILYFWFEKHGNKSHVMVLPSHTCILKHKRNKMEKRKFFSLCVLIWAFRVTNYNEIGHNELNNQTATTECVNSWTNKWSKGRGSADHKRPINRMTDTTE